jgi:hypothetical protein
MSANERSRWKAVFAALNPSPIFEAVAMFAEKLPMKDGECSSKEINGASDLALPNRDRQRSVPTDDDAPAPVVRNLRTRSDSNESDRIVRQLVSRH